MPLRGSGLTRRISPQLQQSMLQQQQMQPQQQGWGDWIKNLFSGTKDALFGQSPGFLQLDRYTPDQQQVLMQLLQGGMNNTQNPTAGFAPIRQQALNEFNQQVVPGLLERFTAGGGYGSNALSSPALAQQLGSAGTGLESMLAAQQAQYGLQNQNFGLKQLGLGLSPQFDYAQTPGTRGLVGGVADFASGVLPPIFKQALSTGNPATEIVKQLWRGRQ